MSHLRKKYLPVHVRDSQLDIGDEYLVHVRDSQLDIGDEYLYMLGIASLILEMSTCTC